jgi:hypothetical protein
MSDAVAGVHSLTNSRDLDLENARISDRGVEALSRTCAAGYCFRSLLFGRNNITGNAAVSMLDCLARSNCQDLTELDLSGNPIGDAAGMQLGEIMMRFPSLKRFRLCDGDLRDASVAALLSAAGQHPTLTHIDLSGHSHSGIETAKALVRTVQQKDRSDSHLTEIILRGAMLPSEAVIACALAMERNMRLTQLDMHSVRTQMDRKVILAIDMALQRNRLSHRSLDSHLMQTTVSSLVSAVAAGAKQRIRDAGSVDADSGRSESDWSDSAHEI